MCFYFISLIHFILKFQKKWMGKNKKKYDLFSCVYNVPGKLWKKEVLESSVLCGIKMLFT